jgi:polyisoprenoid-binding protein YceI
MANQSTWVFDPSHSEITFKVKHLMITNVKGSFKSFDATLLSGDDDFKSASATAKIDVSSIDTNNVDRDNHLKSGDFFDAEQFKTIDFVSTNMERFDEENGKLQGKLTIKGITRDVSFDLEFGGVSKDPWGNIKTGFSLHGQINRDDFGLHWNAALETGGVLVSNEIKITGEFQFTKQAV